MTSPEPRRERLYTGIRDAIGPELADDLMSYLPTEPYSEPVTADEFKKAMSDIRSEIKNLARRFDRLQLTLLAGFMSLSIAVLVAALLRQQGCLPLRGEYPSEARGRGACHQDKLSRGLATARFARLTPLVLTAFERSPQGGTHLKYG